MTRILVLQTAAWQRVRAKVEELLEESPDSEITVACNGDPESLNAFSEIRGLRVIAFAPGRRVQTLRALSKTRFDVQHTFWSGERRYRRMKLSGLFLPAAEKQVHIGDGGSFRLSLKAIVRHSMFRWNHPLPTDHWFFVPRRQRPAQSRERVLILQTAEPDVILRALHRLGQRPLFRNPEYTLFCRNTPQNVRPFRNHPMLARILTHTETRGTRKLLQSLRSEGFDAVVMCFTGNPSYWKMKYFGFLLGARNKVIFNENNDCFYFSVRDWLGLLVHRVGERARVRTPAGSRWTYRTRGLVLLAVKALLFPLRLVWLLMAWVWWRSSAWKA